MANNMSVIVKTRESDVEVTNPKVLDNTGGIGSDLWMNILKRT